MARINSISNKAGTLGFGASLYTKRQCSDNSEIYISSKLSKLYRQAVADCFVKSKLNSIKEFTNKKSSI